MGPVRAWVVRRHGEPLAALSLDEVEPPTPGPGQVRLRVAAAGVGMPDVFLCRGTYPLTPPLPYIPGQELCGTVVAAAPDVDLPVGSRVLGVSDFPAGHGAFAEECLAQARSVFPVPEGLDDADAAGFWIPHFTAWIGLVDRGELGSGERLGVLGAAGSSGLAAVQLGVALGADVVAVASDDAKAALCRRFGAASVVADPGDLGEVDVLYDPVGGEPAERAARSLARGGRHLLVGFAAGAWPRLDARRLVSANAAAVGVYAGGYSESQVAGFHAALGELVADGQLRGTVTERVAFDAVPGVLTALAERRLAGKAAVIVTRPQG